MISFDQDFQREFYKGDLITILFRRKLNLRPGFATIILMLFLNLPIIAASIINHAFLPAFDHVNLLSDYVWWIENLTAIPATLFYFFWLPNIIQDVFAGLVKNKVIEISTIENDDKFGAFLKRFQRFYNHFSLVLFCLIPVGIYMIFFSIPAQRTYNSWQSSGNFIFWYTVFFWTMVFLISFLLIFRGILAIIWVNKLFREFQIKVRVLHPDGAGGLSPLGKFSTRIAYLLGIYGIAGVVAALGDTHVVTGQLLSPSISSSLLPLIIVYILMAPFVFFAPIGAARQAMKAAKDALLLKISDQFDSDRDKLVSLLDGTPRELRAGIQKIENVQKIHKIATGFPVWPFNVENIIRFFTAVSSPVILGLITLVLDFIK